MTKDVFQMIICVITSWFEKDMAKLQKVETVFVS